MTAEPKLNTIDEIISVFARELNPVMNSSGKAAIVYFGMIRVLGIYSAMPTEIWTDAMPTGDRILVHQVKFRKLMESMLGLSRFTVLNTALNAECLWISENAPEDQLRIATTLVWMVAENVLGSGHEVDDVIFAMQALLISAARMRDDPVGTCAWMLMEHRRQFDIVSSDGFAWPDLSGFRGISRPLDRDLS